MDGEERPGAVTSRLSLLKPGSSAGWTSVMPLVYGELRKLASARLRQEKDQAALQPTELVHEAYLRLIRQEKVNWESRTHFFGVASHLMRLVLTDWVRRHKRAKRGGKDARRVDLSSVEPRMEAPAVDGLAQALERLSQIDARQARIVEMRYLAGMTVEETAEALGISPKTVRRDWTVARAWLHRELREERREP